jgi:hypothetical protein
MGPAKEVWPQAKTSLPMGVQAVEAVVLGGHVQEKDITATADAVTCLGFRVKL